MQKSGEGLDLGQGGVDEGWVGSGEVAVEF